MQITRINSAKQKFFLIQGIHNKSVAKTHIIQTILRYYHPMKWHLRLLPKSHQQQR